MKRLSFLGLVLSLMFISCPLPDEDSDDFVQTYIEVTDSDIDYREKATTWTVMYYVDADNDLESYLLEDMEELSEGLESTELMNVIALVDRIDGESSDSSILGEDFSDTRLYRIGADEIYRLSGGDYFPDIGTGLSGEYNMGDAETLKSFIEYCKEYYPADNYALIFTNHGGGVKGDSDVLFSSSLSGGVGSSSWTNKAVCYDETSDNDCIYTAELSDVLDESHSVDLMVYDACLMGLAEIAYQYRPGVAGEFSTDYLAASAPLVWAFGLPYDLIFQRLSESLTGGTGNYSPVVDGSDYETQYYDPASMTAEEFGLIIVEEQERDTQELYSYSVSSQAFALYDLNYIDSVMTELDDWAATSGYTADDTSEFDAARNSCILYEEDSPINYPFYDLYDFAVYYDDGTEDYLLDEYVDSLVVASFGGSSFSSDYAEGQQGLAFFFTEGVSYWSDQWFYTGEDTDAWQSGYYYGKLDFCHADGDGNIDGWFELLQSLYNPYESGTDDYTDYHPGAY
ncbi:MAG: clostripain-related cysteine peptidase [Spirochaetales bacterium]|nr:clostripain-related cysteine peptidase [Spirochaetales bacterium]